MRLTEKLIELEERLQDFLGIVQDLKMKAYALEEQNELLRSQLSYGCGVGDGKSRIDELYEEGFHVCPANFGHVRHRKEQCLFCRDFLKAQHGKG